MQNQNVNKVNLNDNKNGRRKRQRQKDMRGYIFLIVFLAVAIGASLSVTLLFNIKEIEIAGTTMYESTEIINSSGIKAGDNLVRLSTEKAREKILSEMLYIDDVKIKKSFPDKICMELTPSVEMAYVEYRGGYLLISEGYRVLGFYETIENPDLMVIKGYFLSEDEVIAKMEEDENYERITVLEKTRLVTDDDKNEEILIQILEQINKGNISDIVSIDLSTDYDIVLNYNNSINIMIGNSFDIEYKLRYAYHIITNELRQNKSGYLIYHDSLGYSYVSKEEYDEVNKKSETLLDVPENTVTGKTTEMPQVTSAQSTSVSNATAVTAVSTSSVNAISG
ncbi:MAG: FtsQ-type POTRA domain-containing protein [Ruminococcus sp.]|nr:FtsQ-type POTRA domain-containing protein [Ruminococcus sp.]